MRLALGTHSQCKQIIQTKESHVPSTSDLEQAC